MNASLEDAYCVDVTWNLYNIFRCQTMNTVGGLAFCKFDPAVNHKKDAIHSSFIVSQVIKLAGCFFAAYGLCHGIL